MVGRGQSRDTEHNPLDRKGVRLAWTANNLLTRLNTGETANDGGQRERWRSVSLRKALEVFEGLKQLDAEIGASYEEGLDRRG